MPLPAVPSPSKKGVSQIIGPLLRPALTSHYELYLSIPDGNAGDFNTVMRNNGIEFISDTVSDSPFNNIRMDSLPYTPLLGVRSNERLSPKWFRNWKIA